MNSLKVSIVTVCFNSAATIEQTIQSVLNQTYKNIEYIIIDGGSTDGTVDLIKKYEKNIAYWVSEPDHGLYDAMNKGIARASGEIIGIVNSDDWYELSAIEKIVKCFESTDAGLVHGNRIELDEQRDISFIRVPDLQKESIYYKLAVFHPTVFVKKEIYETYGTFNCQYKIAADIDLILRFYDKDVKFHYIDEVLTNFRIGGLSGSRSWRGLREGYHIYMQILALTQRVNANNYLPKVQHYFNQKRRSNIGEFLDRRISRQGNFQNKSAFLSQAGTDNYIVFGAGYRGFCFYRWCLNQNIKITLFVDNSVKRQQGQMGKLEIKSPAVLPLQENALIIIAADEAKDAMEQQLIQMGLVYQRDYLFYADVINSLRQVYMEGKLSFFKQFPKHELRYEENE